MKLLLETTGDFMLMDRSQDISIEADRPAVVSNTPFIEARLGMGNLRVLGQLNDEATDEEFKQYLRDCVGDVALAVESFLSSFGLEKVTQKDPPKPRGRGRRKASGGE